MPIGADTAELTRTRRDAVENAFGKSTASAVSVSVAKRGRVETGFFFGAFFFAFFSEKSLAKPEQSSPRRVANVPRCVSA